MEGVSKSSEVVSTGQQVEKGPGTSACDFFFPEPLLPLYHSGLFKEAGLV